MKRPRSILKILLWSATVTVLIALIAAGILTNVTLRSIEKDLPNTLFEQLHDLSLIIEDLAEAVSAAELAKAVPTAENFRQLRNQVTEVHNAVVRLRQTYVFDNLIHASAFHSVVAPAIADVRFWLSEGVSGYGPETEMTIGIALHRISGAFQKARDLNRASEMDAQKILSEQRDRLEHFLFSVNLLFTLALAITIIMVFLLIRQYLLQWREIEAQAERRRAERLLKDSEHKFRTLFNSAGDGIAIHDMEGHFLEVNEALCSRLGYSREEFLRMTPMDMDVPGYSPLVPERIKAVMQDGHAFFETVHLCRDGSSMHVEVSSRVIDFGGQPVILSIARDITERKRVEEALRASQERFRELAELLPETIFEMDTSGKLTFVNRNAFIHFGYSQEDFERGVNGFEMISPEDRARVHESARRIMNGEMIGLNEYKALRKDGSTFPAILHSAAKVQDGKPVGFRGIVIDITETKKLEAQLRQAHKMEAVGTLAGGIAHDFNNLLQAVQGYAELLLLKKTEGDEGYRQLQEINRAAKRGGELTRQLLTFSRKVESRLQPVDLNRVVDDVRQLLERTIPKMISIELHLMGNLHRVNADASQVEQVLMNLAVNARDAMPDGGTLTIETKNILLDEECHLSRPELIPGKYVLLSVTDKGQGMDKTTLEHIFDPFYTTKEVGKGTGLGLAMVYGIVKNHQGHISCSSKPGEGTAFEICLPASEDLPATPDIVTGATEQWGGRETILLVDDDDALRALGEATLRMFGYTVLSAQDGESALKIYRERGEQIELVVLDLIMPGMGGTQCLQKFLEINPQAKVVIASGYSVADQLERAMEIGARAFIKKPYDVQELLHLVRSLLLEEDPSSGCVPHTPRELPW